MNTIYRVYTTKTVGVFTSKDDAISLIYHIPNSKIEVFNNLSPIGIYYFKNNKLYFNDKEVILEGFIKEWFNINKTEEKSELNIFIPLSPTIEDENKKLSLNELQEKIKKLEEEANLNNEKLDEIKELCENKEENFNEIKEQFDKEKKDFEKEKEYQYQLKNKLEADKRVYFIIKEQLESGELTESSIPVLFVDKYPIFKQLDDNNLISDDNTISTDEINNYLQIAPNYKINNDNNNTFNDLFSSSDPIYIKKYTINSETSKD
jgi:hypothetical protein